MDPQERLTVLLESLIKGVLRIRMVAIMLTMLALPDNAHQIQQVAVALVVALALSVVPLLYWSAIGQSLRRHPMLLAVDVVVTLGVLAVAGPQSPFFYFTLGTAALGGLLHRWAGAAAFSSIMLIGYALVVITDPMALAIEPTFHNQFGIPALYPIVGVTCAGIRTLLERLLETEIELTRVRAAAAATSERTRLARQMHDSLGKTLHGVKLAASALPGQVARAPEQATRTAEYVVSGADAATTQARQLIAGLRDDEVARGTTLCESLRELVDEWEQEAAITTTLHMDEMDDPGCEVTGQVRASVLELLRNIERHARAARVEIRAWVTDDQLLVDVGDDGVGFTVPDDLGDLGRQAHYGLVGVTERLAQVDGRLSLRSAPGEGTRARVRVPLVTANQMGGS